VEVVLGAGEWALREAMPAEAQRPIGERTHADVDASRLTS
jgi:hypothetical protein